MPPVDDPFEQLLRSHRRLAERLEHMTRAVADVGGARDGKAREYLIESLDWMDRAVRRHEQDEEASLFPRLESLAAARPIVEALLREHEFQQRSAQAMRAALTSNPDEIAGHFQALKESYGAHVAREEGELFVLARAHLDEASLARMSDEMNARRGR